MSIICRTDKGWVISHYDYTKKIYTNVLSHSGVIDLTCNKNLFQILTPLMRDQEARNFIKNLSEKEYVLSREVKMKKRPRSASFDHEINIIELALKDLIVEARKNGHLLHSPTEKDYLENNLLARSTADLYVTPHVVYDDCDSQSESSNRDSSFSGGNSSGDPQIAQIRGRSYVIPPNCSFVCSQVENIVKELDGKQFDFILIDPPWWNKSIRRKRAKLSNKGYSMLYNSEIEKIPISNFLKGSGLVGVWCTNAPSHIEAVTEQFFKSWGLKYVATWYWMKVTQGGEAIRPFGSQTEKRPYERIMFGCSGDRRYKNPPPDMCVVSVPSAIHSQKPPLVEVLQEYLPDQPACLELFARYLLPGWTSLGNQVIDLQHLSLYEPSLRTPTT
uniref:Methyltransferase-like protein 4 n=2 Tax=Lygus hesperus TaxID=30085 RepID=A0A0A9ZE37_LYGHE